jgi:hypothetical protein
MYNINYAATTLWVQSWRENVSGGRRTRKVEYHCSKLHLCQCYALYMMVVWSAVTCLVIFYVVSNGKKLRSNPENGGTVILKSIGSVRPKTKLSIPGDLNMRGICHLNSVPTVGVEPAADECNPLSPISFLCIPLFCTHVFQRGSATYFVPASGIV